MSALQLRLRNHHSSLSKSASVMLIAAVGVFGCALVGTRGLDVGTDTHVYAKFFLALGDGPVVTRLEPGFVFVTEVLRRCGCELAGYLAALFGLLLLTVLVATRAYFDYLGERRGYLTFLTATLMCLLLSPVFVNASINAVRQGLASMLVLAALLAFDRRRWWRFCVYGALACSLHYSSLSYLACAPVLLLSGRLQRVFAVAAFVVYSSGASSKIMQWAAPAVHDAIINYNSGAEYRAGTRLDFAAFSMFWYLLPHAMSRAVQSPVNERIRESTGIYLVLMLPFFAAGWGNYSNRFLLPAWLSVSVIVAAMMCSSRVALVRSPVLVRGGVLAACGVFYYFVTQGIVI